MIRITPDIAIDEREIQEVFIRASGPGGQNVNKVATAVQIRFHVGGSPSLPEEVRKRLIRIAGKRMTEDGLLIIDARRFRTQKRNRQDAINRLTETIRKAAEKPAVRRKTTPTPAVKARRLDEKHRRKEVKRMRQPVASEEM